MTFPTAEEGRRLHERLCAGDATATADLLLAYLAPLDAWLAERFRRVDADLRHDAALDALGSLLRRPAQFDPRRKNLHGYLCMSAAGDLRNALRREGRRRTLAAVAEPSPGGNSLGREDDPSFPLLLAEAEAERASERAAVLSGLGPREAAFFDLVEQGEWRVPVLAAVIGLAGRPPADQRRAVKRLRDRLIKRRQRAREAS
jgi:DNA-directed RNA polymerase specialized sigma24 family protein